MAIDINAFGAVLNKNERSRTPIENDLIEQIIATYEAAKVPDQPTANAIEDIRIHADGKKYGIAADRDTPEIREFMDASHKNTAARIDRETQQPVEIPQKMSVDRLMEAIEAVTQIRLMVWRQNAQGEGFGCIKEFGEDIILALHELISRREAMKRESAKPVRMEDDLRLLVGEAIRDRLNASDQFAVDATNIALEIAIPFIASAPKREVDQPIGKSFEEWFRWKLGDRYAEMENSIKMWMEVAWNGANYNKRESVALDDVLVPLAAHLYRKGVGEDYPISAFDIQAGGNPEFNKKPMWEHCRKDAEPMAIAVLKWLKDHSLINMDSE